MQKINKTHRNSSCGVKIHFIFLLFLFSFIVQKTNSQNATNQIPNDSNKIEFIQCGLSRCLISNGYCKENNNDGKTTKYECQCLKEYGTIPNEFNYACNYKKKSQLTAFLLELFISNGAGHFYVENYAYAVPKLITWVFSYYFFIFIRICCKSAEDNRRINILITVLASISCIGMFTWQLLDLVLFGLNKYKDSYEIDLISWNS